MLDNPPLGKKNAIDFFKNRTTHIDDRALLGIDVGGTDIKAVLVDNGIVVDYKEYDWFPAAFLRSRQLIDPICLIVRLLQARYGSIECRRAIHGENPCSPFLQEH
jgi:hypothetical protein